MSKKKIRFLSIFCAMALAFGALAVPVSAETPAEKYKRLQEELKAIAAKIESAQNTQAAAAAQKEQLAEQKRLLEEAIAAKKEVIAQKEADLTAKQEEIAVTRQVILENDELLQQRLVALYKMNNSNAIVQMLSIDSLNDFITVTDSMKRISENDTNLLKNLAEQKQQLETQQAEIDAALAQLQADYADLEADTNALANSIVQADATISAAQAAEESGKAEQEYTKAEAEKAAKEMEAAAKLATSKGSSSTDGSVYVGGLLTWPVPGHSKITCNYGDPDPNGVTHRGMDISGNHKIGADIIAANSGTVTKAAWDNSYGNYVVIDHGAGFSTLYAHCDRLYVKAGQKVETGDVIAALGTTGFSTGPHLHFEVLIDGNPKDPRQYLRG